MYLATKHDMMKYEKDILNLSALNKLARKTEVSVWLTYVNTPYLTTRTQINQVGLKGLIFFKWYVKFMMALSRSFYQTDRLAL